MDIRLATVADAAEIAAIYRLYVEGSTISFELEPPTVEEMARRITRTLERAAYSVVRGYFRVRTPRVSSPGYRARYSELFGCLVERGYYTADAGISLPNGASVGFHESFGFEPVGVYRKAGFKFGACTI